MATDDERYFFEEPPARPTGQAGCSHKFKKARGGMLVCSECGAWKERTYHDPDTSRGGEYMKDQQRRDAAVRRLFGGWRWLWPWW